MPAAEPAPGPATADVAGGGARGARGASAAVSEPHPGAASPQPPTRAQASEREASENLAQVGFPAASDDVI